MDHLSQSRRRYEDEEQPRVPKPRQEQARKAPRISMTTGPIRCIRLALTMAARGPDAKGRANWRRKIYQRGSRETEAHVCRVTGLRVAAFANRKRVTQPQDSTLGFARLRDR